MAGLIAKFGVGMKDYAVDAVVSQLPGLIETAAPQIELGLRKSLRDIRTKHPKNAQVFLQNWTRLNAAVQQELAPAAPTSSSFFGAKRTRKALRRRPSKRTSKNAV
jgi:hypothetical protein